MNKILMRYGGATAVLCALGLPGVAAAQTASAPAPSPSPSIVKDSRTFELRTYYATPGKLEELHARFRNHTIRLFRKHGMTVVGFWAPTAPAVAAADTLVYVLAYPSDQARETAWKGFNTDPEWIAAREASERNGKIVAKVESVMMKATDYSDLK
jgi:NIPSNAP